MPAERRQALLDKLEDRTAVITVVGLGYVGLPVACSFADAGFRVNGLDIDAERVQLLSRGVNPITGAEPGLDSLVERTVADGRMRPTTLASECADSDIFTINVQTPVNDENKPDYHTLRSAASTVGGVLKRGALVVVESTVVPGTTIGLVRSELEAASRLSAGADFLLGACPERVMPGKLLSNLKGVARVCGGLNEASTEVMMSLYRSIVDAPLDPADPTTAEFVKVSENAYRDVQIAFANEVALIAADLGIDVWKVRDLVNKVPFRDMHRPSGGVGGHCIPKDSWLLSAASPHNSVLLPTARAVNDSMPTRVADSVERLLDGQTDKDAPMVLVLGYSYLPESDDVRNSPSKQLVQELRQRHIGVSIHDPFVVEYQNGLSEKLEQATVVVKMVEHSAYSSIDFEGRTLVEANRLGDVGQAMKVREARQ